MYHNPVMLAECLEGLQIKPNGVYVDLTFGGGGHSRSILEQLGENGKLYAFDQDEDAAKQASQIDNPNFQFIEANFRFCRRYLRLHGVKEVNGILADLGVSSYQFDTPERGFSTRFNALLDMRMNQQGDVTAKAILEHYKEEDLHRIFGMYGEVTNAKTLANAIIRNRVQQPIQYIDQLKGICVQYAPRGKHNQYLAQVFQALRIEVNDEMKALEETLLQMPELIKPEGRLVVMTYHSLEDRLVKNFIQKGKFHGELEKDLYGNTSTPFLSLIRKPMTASEAELNANSRARSAKLRIAKRN